MADGFEAMVDAAVPFFAELRDNNTKDWFAPRKTGYQDEIAKPAALFADLLAEDMTRITGDTLKAKVFRIYRDVRFSKDKTPLNAHLHLMWSDPGGDPLVPTWFFGLSPDYFLLGTGLMGLQKEALAQFRSHVDGQGAALQKAIDVARKAIRAEISDWGPAPLARVPKPFAPDHPQADFLRRKALAVHAPIPSDWRAVGLHKATLNLARDLVPVAQAMRPV